MVVCDWVGGGSERKTSRFFLNLCFFLPFFCCPGSGNFFSPSCRGDLIEFFTFSLALEHCGVPLLLRSPLPSVPWARGRFETVPKGEPGRALPEADAGCPVSQPLMKSLSF